MQYDQDAEGRLTPLPKPSIDTGAGVERVSALLQDVHSVYETDVFTPIIAAIEGWTGTRYASGGIETRALRVLADHGRAMTFLAADGVLPGNEGRGYILRRIVRRAVSHGGRIGLDEPFLVRLQGLVVDRLGEAYPELVSLARRGRRDPRRRGGGLPPDPAHRRGAARRGHRAHAREPARPRSRRRTRSACTTRTASPSS